MPQGSHIGTTLFIFEIECTFSNSTTDSNMCSEIIIFNKADERHLNVVRSVYTISQSYLELSVVGSYNYGGLF